jgi:hypothetical protein
MMPGELLLDAEPAQPPELFASCRVGGQTSDHPGQAASLFGRAQTAALSAVRRVSGRSNAASGFFERLVLRHLDHRRPIRVRVDPAGRH